MGNDVLQMKLLSDGTAYSYKNDFIQKSLNTALAYSSIGVDCTEICNPKEDDENVLWDKFYQKTATALAAIYRLNRFIKAVRSLRQPAVSAPF